LIRVSGAAKNAVDAAAGRAGPPRRPGDKAAAASTLREES
jgi:hypothetical protein